MVFTMGEQVGPLLISKISNLLILSFLLSFSALSRLDITVRSLEYCESKFTVPITDPMYGILPDNVWNSSSVFCAQNSGNVQNP